MLDLEKVPQILEEHKKKVIKALEADENGLVDEVSEAYNKYHEEIGKIAVAHKLNPYALVLTLLSDAMKYERQSYTESTVAAILLLNGLEEEE